jgi:hypothetical protein
MGDDWRVVRFCFYINESIVLVNLFRTWTFECSGQVEKRMGTAENLGWLSDILPALAGIDG